mmetsp:Transcript_7143/g.12310  ORF Transcript_7143/g.12310 Transcript_7143/m.12310 type:complete len:358 (+) Transcript_7143:63-1136(+)|eukprot:CAMPEP_0119108112 /NCGR_PEP_ID=MMETSP1180-20130426/13474_1 /TAXON_ID=3052 ORGANISM="Chlamydomonas cf sp, Strain CCMP681" /NCGR_SAMPLE_ID=MMETSP1180 /ASSEMBLY_ACC=CAM_ASM_000741 /LENGTH=357 /DNA_ID=CAMNT_0007093695 /DNA_START=62 /DNA_END=1135 /DNA_ORIENTATION=+
MGACVSDRLTACAIHLTEQGWVPDWVLRYGIRHLLSIRAAEACNKSLSKVLADKVAFVQSLRGMPVAVHTAEANEQHYEVPTEYYLMVLGKHLKYSSCLYKNPTDTLSEAEANMLALYCQRAELVDGQDILELGCGWGSFSLFAAAAFPNSKVTAVSNSRTQKEFIMGQAKQRGLGNIQVLTADMVNFQPPGTYDRIVSIEMFEHMKNYSELLRRCSTWLKSGGKLFVHIFVHKSMPYHFEVNGPSDWMSKWFFTGGTMPSLDLFLYFQEHLQLAGHWYVNGSHYSKTLEDWLVRHDRQRPGVLPVLAKAYGGDVNGWTWYNRWRMFYIACSELFRYNGGQEWGVGHYLFLKPSQSV